MKITYTPAKEKVVHEPESFTAVEENYIFEVRGKNIYIVNEAPYYEWVGILIPIGTLLAFVEAYNNRGK